MSRKTLERKKLIEFLRGNVDVFAWNAYEAVHGEVVEVDFIVMDSYLPYTAIVARPWLHA